MADQANAASDTAMATARNIPDGLTRVHVAVLRDDRDQVHTLLKSGEYGINARSKTGATPVMLASLYGRTEIFLYLVKKKADLATTDYQGYAAISYAKGPLTQAVVRKYEDIAIGEPRRKGRHFIYRFLKTVEKTDKKARQQSGIRVLDEQRSGARLSEEAQQPPDTRQTRRLFLRSGRHLGLVEARVLAETEVDIKLCRKSTGVIRSKTDKGTIYTFALSGWAGVEGQNVLCNKKFSDLVRRVCGILGFDLKGHCRDIKWKGAPADKRGSYNSCHAEKQLAVWVLTESLSQFLGSDELTVASVARLKELSSQLPVRFIELDHEPCPSCVQFLRVLRQEAGLKIGWKSRKWFVAGQRPRLQFPGGPSVASSGKRNTENTYVDEVDEDVSGESSEAMASENNPAAADDDSDTMDDEDNASPNPNIDFNGDTFAEDKISNATQALSGLRQVDPLQILPRLPGDPYPKGHSPIVEPPQNKLPRWPNVPSREVSPEWDVDKVLASRMIDGQQVYLVKWKHFAVTSCTWEPEEYLINARDAIDRFRQATGASAADAMTDDAIEMSSE